MSVTKSGLVLTSAFVCFQVACELTDGEPGGGPVEDPCGYGVDGPVAEADGPEQLMAIYHLPVGEGVVDSFTTVELSLPDQTTGTRRSALRASRGSFRPLPAPDAYWRARFAYETARRQAIDDLVVDLRAGRRTLQRAVPKSACGGCGEGLMCWQGACTASVAVVFPDGVTSVACELVEVVDVGVGVGGVQVNVLLDQSEADATTRDAATRAASDFASTFSQQLTLLGQSAHTGVLDRDGDGRMTVVFTSQTSDDPPISLENVGFFYHGDFLPAGDSDATGNEADLLWARVPGAGDVTAELAAGTLAHEYAHLASYALRVQGAGTDAWREAMWLDEGLAHLMEDLSGWGRSNVRTVEAALSGWANGSFAGPLDSVAQRGRAYLLLRHIVDTQAKAQGAEHAADATAMEAAADVVSSLVTEEALGFEHQLLADLGSEGAWQWLLGTYATCNANVVDEAAHAYDFLPVGTAAVTGHLAGANPRGTFPDARGGRALLEGPAYEDLDQDTDLEYDSWDVYLGGSIFFEVKAVDASGVTVVSDDDTVQLHHKVQSLR